MFRFHILVFLFFLVSLTLKAEGQFRFRPRRSRRPRPSRRPFLSSSATPSPTASVLQSQDTIPFSFSPRPSRSPEVPSSSEPTPSPSSSPASDAQICNIARRQEELSDLRVSLLEAMNNNPDLLPAFVRAAFHDCFTATSDKPNSGCNGSLRLEDELENTSNSRLGDAIFALENLLQRLSCTSFADAIQLASAVAIFVGGGPDVITEVVNPASPRVDADEVDTIDGELPSGTSNFNTLLQLYERKGFNAQDLISSSAGAHSLGGFRSRGGIVPFTTDRLSVSSGYAHNIVQLADTNRNLAGFNTLPSDETLNTNAQSLQKLGEYAGCAPGVGQCERNDGIGGPILNEEFAIFCIKLSRMTGATVGNSAALSQGL